MFLFIFESIGTSELILIGAVALIVFGPRKLPELAKTLGKTIADFKNTTNEFKTTWEREASFEDTNLISDTTVLQKKTQTGQLKSAIDGEKSAGAAGSETSQIIPEIKEIDAARFDFAAPKNISSESETSDPNAAEKQNWF